MFTLLNVYLVVMTLAHAWGVLSAGHERKPLAMVVNAALMSTSILLLAESLL